MKTLKFLTLITLLMVFTAVTGTFWEWNSNRHYTIGGAVQDFMLQNISGDYFSLNDYKHAKGFILVFTSLQCPYAEQDTEKIKALSDTYLQKGFPVIAIDPTLSEQDIFKNSRHRLADKNFSFPYLIDGQQSLAQQFDIDKVPQVCILQKEQGHFILKYKGAIDNIRPNNKQEPHHFVTEKMNLLLKGKKITLTSNNPTGCILTY